MSGDGAKGGPPGVARVFALSIHADYHGRGVLTIVRGLDAALSLVRVEAARQCREGGRRLDAALLGEAFRQADFLLNHLAVGEALAAAWSDVEYGHHGAMVAGSELALDRA